VLHEPRVVISRVVAENVDAERDRFLETLLGVQAEIDRMLSADDLQDGEQRDVLETFRMFAEDRGWRERTVEAIEGGLTAEAAVQHVFDDQRARIERFTDPYLRERLSDLQDLTNRLLLRLTGRAAVDPATLPDDMVVIARDMGPADLLDYDRARLRAVVLEEGSALSHVAIVARALDIPVVGRAPQVLSRIEPGDAVVVDGDEAVLFIRPGEDVLQSVAQTIQLREEQRQRYAALRSRPAVSRDGVAVSLMLNAGLLIDMQHLESTGADGVGLFRTEIPFMVHSEFPDLASQTQLYTRILDQANDRPVVFRTLDVGGDKVLPYVGEFGDENPAMGWRAIRIGLDRPAMLRQQLRALIAAAAGRPLSVMFPMVAEVQEFVAARRLLEIEIDRARRRGDAIPQRLRVGVMLEVPALLWQLDHLLARLDFISVGSNDLFQFLFAADRGNARLAGRYDCLSPAALRTLDFVVSKGRAAGVEISICGEMASKPIEALALLGLGVRTLSMTPSAVGPVKAMLRSVELSRFVPFLRERMSSDARTLRETIKMYARDHGISV